MTSSGNTPTSPLRRLAALVVALGASASLFGQVGEPRSDFAIGFNAGAAFNTVSFDPTVKQTMHPGSTFGLTMRYTCEKYFSMVCAIQLEVNYTRLGWKEDIRSAADEPLPDTYSRHHDYLQVPLLARLGWGREERGVMGYLVAGPQVGYCLSEKTSRSETWTLDSQGNPDRPNGMYAQYDMPMEKKFDYGITAGLGVEVSTRIGHFMAEGRYYYGLSDIYGNSKKDVFARSANGTIMAKVTYLFSVGK